MSVQDKTEKVLRSLHVLLSKSEPYPGAEGKVIIEKQQVIDLLSELNQCIYDIMEEYELTKQSRDKAEREFRRQGDQIIWDASRKAEDIYAASVMYTDGALNSIQEIMKQAEDSMVSICQDMEKQLKEQRVIIKTNQSELKTQLQELVDTEKYLKLIENYNKEIQKEKEKKSGKGKEENSLIYADRQSEVKVNQDVLKKLGLTEEEPKAEEKVPLLQEDPVASAKPEVHKGWKGFASAKNK